MAVGAAHPLARHVEGGDAAVDEVGVVAFCDVLGMRAGAQKDA